MNLRKLRKALGKQMVVVSHNRKEIRVAAGGDQGGRLEYGVSRDCGMSESEAAQYLKSKMPVMVQR